MRRKIKQRDVENKKIRKADSAAAELHSTMAAPSSTFPCRSPIKSSLSSSAFSSFNLNDYSVRRRSISCCSSFSTSLTCCCSSGSGDPQEGKIRLKRSAERNVIAPIKRLKNENTLSVNNVGSKNRSISFKDIFERRSLWRRIFFASKKVRSIILLNVITIIYASNIPVVKEVEAFVDPEVFTVVRFVFSAIPFLPFVLQARDDIQTRNAGIELGTWVSLGYLMQALGLLTSDAGRASFISMFTVVVVPLLDGMLGATIPARTWFGALMSIVGVGMLESSGSPPCVGDLFNFLSTVFFGIHMLRTEHISRSISKDNFLPLLGYEVSVVAVFSSVWCLIGGLTGGIEVLNPSSWTWSTFWEWTVTFPWIPALYTGIFSTGLCLWIEIAAMRDVSATDTAIIYGLEPVWGAGFAWFLLGERWGIHGWIGAALVLGGSLAVQASSTSSLKDEKNTKKSDDEVIEDKQGVFSSSMVVVSSREDSHDYLNR